MTTYHDLLVYKNSYQLAVIIHKMSLQLTQDMRDIAHQIRRCSKSIPTNIAEGYARGSSIKDRINFLRISLGSNDEMITHLKFICDCQPSFHKELVMRLIETYTMNGKRLNNLIKFNKKQDSQKTRQQEN